MKQGQGVDLAMYARALSLLFTHPSIFVAPLAAALIDLLVSSLSPILTDPVGGLFNSIFQFAVQIVYGFAFGIAVIQASHIWRGRRGTFDEAWDEARSKAGGIILAVIGFYFFIYVAGQVGGYLGPIGALLLPIVAAFFLLYTIPAAAIGGLPGGMAISGSYRAARANILGTIVLALLFYALFYVVPIYTVNQFGVALGLIGYKLVLAFIRGFSLAYLAFPFSKQYDDTAFRARW